MVIDLHTHSTESDGTDSPAELVRAAARAGLDTVAMKGEGFHPRVKPGDRVATLCWNHHAHLECYFGIPAAGDYGGA